MPMQPAPVWYDGYDAFPCVLAHEYHRLKSLYEAGQYYGAYFQAKDVIESTVKYVILAACAWAKAAGIEGREAGYERVLACKNPSLGLWVNLGREIQRFFKQPQFKDGGMPEPLWALLGKTIAWMDKNRLVSWRNEEIGHGALAFDDSPAFRADLLRIISVITEFYRRNAALFAQHTLLTDGIALAGPACARNLAQERGALTLHLGAGDPIALSPFILHMHHGVFFFDEVESRSMTRMMNYPAGEDSVVRTPEITSYYAKLSDQLRSQHIDSSRDVEGGYLSESESALLDRLNVDERYVTPEHIKRWLQDALRRHVSGAFLLTMERGCGKSTFCQKLSRLYKAPELLAEDLDVRTYHFSRAQHSGVSEFKEGLEDQWAREYSEHGQTHMGRFRRFTHFEQDEQHQPTPPAKQTAMFLGSVLDETRRSRGKQRILLVLDGLDEITDPDLWQYLRCGNELPQGVYLLLTCRSAGSEDEPLPEGLAARLDALHTVDRADFARSGEDNRAFLLAYAQKRLPKWTQAELDPLLALCGWRILDLSMNCRLLQNGLTLLDLQGEQAAVVPYVRYLELHYGDARRMMLRRLLLALCTFGEAEPLSLPEIAWMTGRGHVSLDLVAMMNDLAPLLYVQRGYSAGGRQYAGANRYRLVNAGLANALREYLADLLPAFIASLSEAALARAQDKEPPCDGQKLVLAHILDPAAGVPLFSSLDASQLHTLVVFIEQAYPLPMQRVLDLQRAQATCMQATWAGRDLLDRKALPDVTDYAWALCRMGEIRSTLGHNDEAAWSFSSAAKLLIEHGRDQCLLMLTVLLRQQQLRLASGEYADDIAQKLLNIHKYIAKLQNGGHLHEDEKRPAALLDAEACIALCEQLYREMTVGSITSGSNRFGFIQEALSHAEHAASTLIAQQNIPPSHMLNLHAALSGCITAYNTRYNQYSARPSGPFTLAAATDIHDSGLDAASALLQRGEITPLSFVTYGSKTPLSPEQSASHLRNADTHTLQSLCDLYEALLTGGELPDTRPLADAYLRLAQLSEDWEQKLASFQRAYNLYEELRKRHQLSSENELSLHSAALGKAMYAAASDSYTPQPDNGKAERLRLREARAKCAEKLYAQSAAQKKPLKAYLNQYRTDSSILEGSYRAQGDKETAKALRTQRRTLTRQYLWQDFRNTLQVAAASTSVFYLPVATVLLIVLAFFLFQEVAFVERVLSCTVILIALVLIMLYLRKHVHRKLRPGMIFIGLLECIEILSTLFICVLLLLFEHGISPSELLCSPASPEVLSAIAFVLRQPFPFEIGYARSILLLLFSILLSSFLVEGFTLHVYLRLKLRKVRRLLKALTDRVMHSPENKA